MLKQLTIKNLTVFSESVFDFSPNLNVIIGENSTGKSHLLKIAYSVMATSSEAGKKNSAVEPTKAYLQKAIAEKLINVFRPDSLGRLVRRRQGRDRCEVSFRFDQEALDSDISFATNAKSDVQIDRLPTVWLSASPLYLPTRELLTIYPGFASMYSNHYLPFEETWLDTCLYLGAPAVRGPREAKAAELLEPLEEAMGGRVVLDSNGRFYLRIPGSGNMEMSLVAEGLRKLAMLARLIATGTILDQGYLFWDEPEANLNPRLIRKVAAIIDVLSRQGIQIFIATHSYFLLKELDMLSRKNLGKQMFFALHKDEDENGVTVEKAEILGYLDGIVSLDEELAQYDRELELRHA